MKQKHDHGNSDCCFFFFFIAAGLNRKWRNEISLVEEIEPVLKKQNKVDLKKKKLEELKGEKKQEDLQMMFTHNQIQNIHCSGSSLPQ